MARCISAIKEGVRGRSIVVGSLITCRSTVVWVDSLSVCWSIMLWVDYLRSNPSVSFHCLNDMWALHIPSNTWTEVRVGDTKPPPRYGFSMIWSEDLHLSLFGGETHGANGRVSCRERVLLEDFWHFTIKDIVNEAHSGPVVVGEWQQEIYEGKICPRSHYAAIFITQRYQEPVCCTGHVFSLPYFEEAQGEVAHCWIRLVLIPRVEKAHCFCSLICRGRSHGQSNGSC